MTTYRYTFLGDHAATVQAADGTDRAAFFEPGETKEIDFPLDGHPLFKAADKPKPKADPPA